MNYFSITFIVLICAFTFTAHANEALLEESSGGLAPVEGDSTTIRMVSERVVIELGD